MRLWPKQQDAAPPRTLEEMHAIADGMFNEKRFADGAYTGVLHVIDGYGDTRVMWNVDNLTEIELAREFEAICREAGMMTIATPRDGTAEDATILGAGEFHPEAHQKVLAMPYTVGG